MDLCAIVVVACHFATRDTLCTTTIARLEAALRETTRKDRPWRYIFVVTGDVPYEPGSTPLNELMRDYLRNRGWGGDILMATGKTGSFAEPQLVVGLLHSYQKDHPDLDQLIVVSSEWQFWTGRPFWELHARKVYLPPQYVEVLGTGGWRTRFIYALYALVIRIALRIGLWPALEHILDRRVYSRRSEGFRWNGCA